MPVLEVEKVGSPTKDLRLVVVLESQALPQV
jgi:hypothetical protein